MEDGLHVVTLCENCDHVVDRKVAPYAQLCIKHPRLPRFDRFVTASQHDSAPPFLRCGDVNGGKCYLFEPVRDGQLSLEAK